MTNLHDVARIAGVSTATISMVLNNHPAISDETRHLVRNALDRAKYQRRGVGRPRGSRLVARDERVGKSSRKKLRIAFFEHFSLPVSSLPLTHPVYSCLIEGIRDTLARAGHEFCLRSLGHVDDAEVFVQQAARFDGVLVLGVHPLDEMQRNSPPLVRVMGIPSNDRRVDHITYDNMAIGPLAANWLLSRGHRRCAVLYDSVAATMRQRTDGCIARLRQGGAEVLVSDGDDFHQLDYAPKLRNVLAGWRDATPRPTGLFVPADLLAQRAHEMMLDMGMVPGRDMEIIGVNNETSFLAGLSPRPTTLDIHIRAIAEFAVELLLRRVANPVAPRVCLALTPEICSE